LPERFSVSFPPVANDICRSAVPAPKYLPERRSTAFPHHYTPDVDMTPDATLFDLTSLSPPSTLLKITVYCLFICWQSGTDTKLIKKRTLAVRPSGA